MQLELSEEQRMIKELVAKFVDNELMPLEAAVLQREIRGEKLALTEAEEAPLLKKFGLSTHAAVLLMLA